MSHLGVPVLFPCFFLFFYLSSCQTPFAHAAGLCIVFSFTPGIAKCIASVDEDRDLARWLSQNLACPCPPSPVQQGCTNGTSREKKRGGSEQRAAAAPRLTPHHILRRAGRGQSSPNGKGP
ncbi:hypothetical protein BDZ88DRAFT_407735 [Geranomyces variabilis]|nr:hypothetical protein BDZ88DRAFT_407735 [Geranomyces variabilis]